jgi:glycosyltransferase involved in cell wall biosynthesis
MKVVWVTRSFLDYRIPVYKELNSSLNSQLILVYNADYVPERVHHKVQEALGENAIGLRGEFKIGPDDFGDFLANKKARIPFQPRLIKTIKKLKPDVLISDGFFQWTYAALWIRLFYKIKHIMCYERTHHTERHAQWHRILYRKLVSKWIDAYCASGKLCGEYLQTLGIEKNKITYGHMVADLSGISQAKNLNNGNVRISYLYVGKLIERKGIKQLLDAWYIFQKDKEEQVVLKIVGSGEMLEYLKNFLKAKSLSNVELLGHVDYDEMFKIYNNANIFLIPTLEDNWSLVVPEAMANHLPILCSKYNGCYPEYVTESNGWIFDPLNKSDFVKKLEISYNCDNLKVMGENSKKIISNYTPLHAANAILDAIKLI